ncbi:hypothetical protein CR105_15835 [Massilia eurypsychrophila]|jgi:hypothetical protein|uniref:DUF3108 domain-containing protein n=1 Tax=Massilia eurypsychrophila TaxID=1485217 RepID=A0A2G8TEV5_9BURK|nr:DUF3108 domain-containing protein [Massilia eurypsychrophila]PIL44168.1 hypothetical protein CR105_15835 [Massilia eurypsychrophila]
MHSQLKLIACGAMLAAVTLAGAAEHVAVKRPVDVPPSADLSYSIKASQKGFSLSGDATISWRVTGAKYTLRADTRAALFGSILDSRSEGTIDSFGVAPGKFVEKRLRRDPTTTTFDRAAKRISFTEGKETYPIIGGEQDRSSITWQLVAVARAAPEKFTPGSQWVFFVAGRRDAEPWTFKVVGKENIRTGVGALETVHLVRLPPPDSKEQTLDIWLAPAQEWYPARLRFTDGEDEFVDQTLEKIARK